MVQFLLELLTLSAEDKWTLVSYSTIGPLLLKKPQGPNLILPSNRSMLIKGHYLFITTTVPDATCQVSRTLPSFNVYTIYRLGNHLCRASWTKYRRFQMNLKVELSRCYTDAIILFKFSGR